MTARAAPPELLALSPGDLSPETAGSWLARARAAVGAGLSGILLREPALEDGPTLRLACELRSALGRGSHWLGVHDRVHVALAAGADAVHLGFRSLEPRVVRALVGERLAVGFSSHAPDGPQAWEGADYLFFGPVFRTPAKAGLAEPLAPTGLEGLAARARETALPLWGIGGIDPARAARVIAAGARGVAVRGGIFAAPGRPPEEGARAYLEALLA